MSDLKFVIDDPEGLAIALGEAYGRATINAVTWYAVDEFGAPGAVLTQGRFLPQPDDPEAAFRYASDTVLASVEIETDDGSILTVTSPAIVVSATSRSNGTVTNLGVSVHHEDLSTSDPEQTPPLTVVFANTEVFTASAKASLTFDYVDTREFDGTSGRYTVSGFGDGEVVRNETAFDLHPDGSSVGGYFSWSSQTKTFRSDGSLESARVNWDSGLSVERFFETDGTLARILQSDYTDVTGFVFASINFRDGLLTGRVVDRDDGLRIETQITNGEVVRKILTDPQSTAAWDTSSGFPTLVTTDHGVDGQWAWTSQVIYYGQPGFSDGLPISRGTTFDDGRTLHVTYGRDDDGQAVLATASHTDAEAAHAWDTRETTYDAHGHRISTTINFDDGAVGQTDYAGGIRSVHSISDVEDVRAFTTILRTYDEGLLSVQTNTMDDGRVIERRFDDSGEWITQVIADTADSFVWSVQTTLYAEGEITSRTLLFDTEMQRRDTFVDGERTLVERLDLADAHRWDSITDRYEDGALVSQVVVMDDDLIG